MSTQIGKRIFALDIGTRSVVGIIMDATQNRYTVVDYISVEHKERSMVDGQIHDVVAVAEVIKEVKERLEEKHGPLHKVAVAAAGRSLKTKRAHVHKSIAGRPLLTRSDILAMELEGVQMAQSDIAQELEDGEQTNYYCVGYSVIQYFLDDQIIGNLVDQRGKEVSVDVIATFLPRVVVDSLISALKRAQLEMEALTLEPIAAINVLIPSTMRRLNVALVDIGAGTSDIAITSEGAITAYGMVPCAGDEVTDALSQEFLLDFPVAEKIKRLLYCEEQVEFEDILGFQHSLPSQDVVKKLQTPIQSLAQKICEKILQLNGKSPQAVMLIGGGALTPTLNHWIAETIGIPTNRVGIRGIQLNQQIHFEHEEHQGPESVTPIGIALAAEQHPVKYMSVTVNGNTVRLFDLQKLTVGDAILALGLNMKRLHGKPGMAMSVEVNGKLIHIPGTHGHPPLIKRNGEQVELDQSLQENDEIEVIQGDNGEDAQACVQDVIGDAEPFPIILNGEKRVISPKLSVNDQPAAPERALKDRDQMRVTLPSCVHDILLECGWDTESFHKQTISYRVNGEEKTIEYKPLEVFVNGRVASLKTTLKPHDELTIQEQTVPTLSVKDVIPEDIPRSGVIQVTFNDQPVNLSVSSYLLYKNGTLVDENERMEHGDTIEWKENRDQQPIFQDVFRYIEVDTSQAVKGKRMSVLINDQPASFESPIRQGDQLEIKWV